ncbi:MAG TPA: zinc ribbon domain-containing protein [Caldithrix abyssi]|uniref:Zinc ribbon domain-containing protein n=1 Tax=Caldithrix abyssi TaxID=187145 RepID=A0A7V4U3K5_CALAY|nr:zinc ribbon domain-containing protein [Caldithrix abyssi]
MGCSWYEPGYWLGWHWAGQIFWIIFVLGLGILIYKMLKNDRGKFQQSQSKYSAAIIQENCPHCGAPTEKTYIRCPECHFKLKTNCPGCGRIVKTSWDICPYCETDLKGGKEPTSTS